MTGGSVAEGYFGTKLPRQPQMEDVTTKNSEER